MTAFLKRLFPTALSISGMAALAALGVTFWLLIMLGLTGILTDPDLGAIFFEFAFSVTAAGFLSFLGALSGALIIGSVLTIFWKIQLCNRFAIGASLLLAWSAYQTGLALMDDGYSILALAAFAFHIGIFFLTYSALRAQRRVA